MLRTGRIRNTTTISQAVEELSLSTNILIAGILFRWQKERDAELFCLNKINSQLVWTAFH